MNHQFEVKVIEDSINALGERCLSLEATYPRFIHSQIMTHRALSKSSASSRAVPVMKMLRQVWHSPAMPLWFGASQKGMQASRELIGWRKKLVVFGLYYLRYFACFFVWFCLKLGLHKQIANRYLEPWMWHTVIITGTEWSNALALRCHEDAQPETQHLFRLIRKAIHDSMPKMVRAGEWGHLPYVLPEERQETAKNSESYKSYKNDLLILENLPKISVGRSCRVSYLTHDGHKNYSEDIQLAERIGEHGHHGAYDHTCMAAPGEKHGNLVGWKPYRKMLQGESDFGLKLAYQEVAAWMAFNRIRFNYETPVWFLKRTFNKWYFELPEHGVITPARAGLGSGHFPDYFYVILVREPVWDKADLHINGAGVAYRCFLVQVPGLDKKDRYPLYQFGVKIMTIGKYAEKYMNHF